MTGRHRKPTRWTRRIYLTAGSALLVAALVYIGLAWIGKGA